MDKSKLFTNACDKAVQLADATLCLCDARDAQHAAELRILSAVSSNVRAEASLKFRDAIACTHAAAKLFDGKLAAYRKARKAYMKGGRR